MTEAKLRERLMALLREVTTDARRYKELEELTDIASDRWKAVFMGRQRPTLEMVEFTAKLWPDYAYWLVTGDTEPEYGNIAPQTASCEFLSRGEPNEWRTKERRYKQEFLNRVAKNADLNKRNATVAEEQLMQVREDTTASQAYLWLEKILKGFGEKPSAELGILESDAVLHEFRKKSREQTLSLLTQTGIRRENYFTFKESSPKFASLWNLLAKLAN